MFGAAGVDRFLSEADGDCGAVVFVDDNSRLRDTKRGKHLVKVDGSFRCVDKGNKFSFAGR